MPTPLTPETLIYGFTPASEPQVSPDGTSIAYVVSATDRESGKGSSQVWQCGIDGRDARRLTYAGERNRSPRWSPDGSELLFVSDRGKQQGLYALPMAGGEARTILEDRDAIGDPAWSADGRFIAFTAPVDPDVTAGEKPKEGTPAPVRVTSRIDYKQDNRGYLDDKRAQVFLVDSAGGEARQLTTEAVDHNFPAWSPDGPWLAVQVPNRNGMCSQLQLIPAGGGDPVIAGPEMGVVSTWSWSPDGSRIVFAGDTEQTWQTDIFVLNVATLEARRITGDLQCLPAAGFPTIEPPSPPVWLDDSHVLFHAVRAGAAGLWVVDLETGAVEQVEGSRSLRSGLSSDAARRYFVQGLITLESTGEITVFDRAQGASRVITTQSAPVFAESPVAHWERFDVRRDGFTIEAWLLKPPDFDPAQKYPLVLDVHGGPNGFYGYAFNPIQQLLATNGVLTLYSNPRGSSSYGRHFTQQVAFDWGGEDFHDLMAVVDEVAARPYVDEQRLGIWGYSYGGYMTAWTISQTQRFKAAVCGAPCFDLESMFGTSDISHTFGILQWGGAPHEAREWYATHSPSQFAHNTRTPTLIIHGEADDRCPIGQGEQMFVTLKRAGVDVEFARYPGGSHLFMRTGPAEHRLDVLQRVLGWFKERLGDPAPA